MLNQSYIKIFKQFVVACLIGLLLFFGQYQHYIYASIVFFVFSFITEKKLQTFILLSFVALIFKETYFYTLDFSNLHFFGKPKSLLDLIFHFSLPYELRYTFSLLGIFLLLGLSAVYARMKFMSPVLFVTAFFLLLAFCFHSLTGVSQWYRGILLVTMIVLAKSFWYLCLNLQSIRFEKNINLNFNLSKFIIPFWSHNLVRSHGVPNGWREVEQGLSKSRHSDLLSIQVSGLKLIFWSLCLKYLAAFMVKFFYDTPLILPLMGEISFTSLALPNPQKLGFNVYNSLNRPFLEKISVMIINPFIYILREPVGDGGVLIGYIRLLGIYTPRQVYRPYLATNFNDFFRRIYYYYNYLLIEFFIIPLYQLFSGSRINRKLKLFFSVLIGVFVGALIMNYLRHDILLAKYGPIESFGLTLKRSFYFGGVALLAAFSSVGENKPSSGKIHWMRLLLIYFSYSFFFNLQGNIQLDQISDRVIYLRYLFFTS